jgi:hypothetical protein
MIPPTAFAKVASVRSIGMPILIIDSEKQS